MTPIKKDSPSVKEETEEFSTPQQDSDFSEFASAAETQPESPKPTKLKSKVTKKKQARDTNTPVRRSTRVKSTPSRY